MAFMMIGSRKVWIVLGVLLGVLIVLILEEHVRHRWLLTRWQARMEARGESFDVNSLRPPRPPEGANIFGALLLESGRLNSELWNVRPPTRMKVDPGRAVPATWRQEWEIESGAEPGSTNGSWPLLVQALESSQEPLARIRELLKTPQCDAEMEYHRGEEAIGFNHLAGWKRVTDVLRTDAMVELHSGDLAGAQEDILAMLGIVKCLETEPVVISQLVRMACLSLAANSTWLALQTPGWDDAQLAQLQSAWSNIELQESFIHALRMERAMVGISLAKARRSASYAARYISGGTAGTIPGVALPPPATQTSDLVLDALEASGRLAKRVFYTPLWQWFRSYDDELSYGRQMQLAIESLQAANDGAGWSDPSEFDDEEERNPWLDAASVTGGFAQKCLQAETTKGLAMAAIAIERFRLRHGKLPKLIDELVPEFLSGVPLDPIDAMPIRMLVRQDGYILHAPCQGEEDEQGGQNAFLEDCGAVWPLGIRGESGGRSLPID